MGSSKMNQISDPLASQKTAASNLGLQNYQQASSNVPGLQGYYNQNFGQSAMQTLGNQDPLFQSEYGSLEKDLTGSGGPFASLKQNLLGSFDTGQTNATNTLQQQLQAQGLLGSGAGMAVLGNQGVNAAQQRALLGSQADVQELGMADQLSQQLMQQNQLQGYSNPMAALGMISNLSSPPQFQDINNTYYTPQSKFQTTADILGGLEQGGLSGAAVAGMSGSGSGGGSSSISGATGGANSGSMANPYMNQSMTLGGGGSFAQAPYYSPNNQAQSMMSPQMMAQIMMMGGG